MKIEARNHTYISPSADLKNEYQRRLSPYIRSFPYHRKNDNFLILWAANHFF